MSEQLEDDVYSGDSSHLMLKRASGAFLFSDDVDFYISGEPSSSPLRKATFQELFSDEVDEYPGH
jgi:hypothetical protein